MSIQDIREKINGLLSDDTSFFVIVLFLVAIASFGLGKSSVAQITIGEEKSERKISQSASVIVPEKEIEKVTVDALGKYVASRNSNKYHLPWCSGAKRITDENKIWFQTKEEAKAAGYTPAGNCKGI